MSENFLLKKDIKDIRISFFERGFAIPVDKQEKLSAHLSCGRLAHGEKRTIKFILDGKYFDATLRSVGFNRKKFPNHSEMWQINWKIDDAISKKVTEIFSKSYLDCSEDGEYFVIYSTAKQDIFYFEPIFNREIFIPKISELALENLLELPILTDEAEKLIAKSNLMKIRKMTLSLGEDLKKNYKFRCQICGCSVGEFYGVNLAECHHITPFSESLNSQAKCNIVEKYTSAGVL
ncbi:MAG: hypothetical protein IJQ85_01025 [Selenomonadaceae bacterium]|nr:hypothetical protein [Selenomonadaceae bacterium]